MRTSAKAEIGGENYQAWQPLKNPAPARFMIMNQTDMVRLANSTRLRLALQMIEAVETDGYISAEDLAEVMERVGEMVRGCGM